MTTELPEVARALLDPGIFPEKPSKVDLVQTQMSFVFLAGKYVYKIKKPVDLGYLDYTTLEKRRFFCEQEVKLNRRLCGEAYVAVIPIRKNHACITLDGPGETIEYAVKMLYLPQERMMNILLDRHRVSQEMIGQLANKLVDFHAKAETNPVISVFGALEAIRYNSEENFSQTRKYLNTLISPRQHLRIKEYSDSIMHSRSDLFSRRAAGGRIRDCHGDLHTQHVCFSNEIYIFDCIEFNDRFRYCDAASEVAFLAMDLDHFGRADLAHTFIDNYIQTSGDQEIRELLKFYKSYRAMVRGKVSCFKFDDPYITDNERKMAGDSARSYFELADAYSRSRPRLFITVGLVGSGKTTLAHAIARRLGLTVISSDVVRKQMAAIPAGEHRLDAMDHGLYSAQFSEKVYDRLLSDARNILTQGDSVLLDASFIKSNDRMLARDLASTSGSDFFVLECFLDEENTRRRLAERFKGNSISDGRWEIYEPQKKKFDPVSEVPADHHFRINSAMGLNEQINQIIEKIG